MECGRERTANGPQTPAEGNTDDLEKGHPGSSVVQPLFSSPNQLSLT